MLGVTLVFVAIGRMAVNGEVWSIDQALSGEDTHSWINQS